MFEGEDLEIGYKNSNIQLRLFAGLGIDFSGIQQRLGSWIWRAYICDLYTTNDISGKIPAKNFIGWSIDVYKNNCWEKADNCW